MFSITFTVLTFRVIVKKVLLKVLPQVRRGNDDRNGIYLSPTEAMSDDTFCLFILCAVPSQKNARASHEMAQFVLKIAHFAISMEPTPLLEKVPSYSSYPDYGSWQCTLYRSNCRWNERESRSQQVCVLLRYCTLALNARHSFEFLLGTNPVLLFRENEALFWAQRRLWHFLRSARADHRPDFFYNFLQNSKLLVRRSTLKRSIMMYSKHAEWIYTQCFKAFSLFGDLLRRHKFYNSLKNLKLKK